MIDPNHLAEVGPHICLRGAWGHCCFYSAEEHVQRCAATNFPQTYQHGIVDSLWGEHDNLLGVSSAGCVDWGGDGLTRLPGPGPIYTGKTAALLLNCCDIVPGWHISCPPQDQNDHEKWIVSRICVFCGAQVVEAEFLISQDQLSRMLRVRPASPQWWHDD